MICDSTKCPEREPKKAEKKKVPMKMGYPKECVDLQGIPRVGRQGPCVLLRFHDPCYPENIWPRETVTSGAVHQAHA